MNTQHDFKVVRSTIVQCLMMLVVCGALPACQLGIDEHTAPGPIEEPRIREVEEPEDNRLEPPPPADEEPEAEPEPELEPEPVTPDDDESPTQAEDETETAETEPTEETEDGDLSEEHEDADVAEPAEEAEASDEDTADDEHDEQEADDGHDHDHGQEQDSPRESAIPDDEIQGPRDNVDDAREEFERQLPEMPGGIISADELLDGTPRDEDDLTVIQAENAEAPEGPWVQLSGRVLFNDRRTYGNFDGREDYWGATGRQCGRDGVRGDGSDCAKNYLGALYAVVDVFERDEHQLIRRTCDRREKLGAATIGADGRFSLYVPYGDDCANDDWDRPALAVRVRLRYCNANHVCFSFASSRNDEYALYHPGASYDDPLEVRANRSYDLGAMVFTPEGQDPTVAEHYSIAANYYATLVDTMEKMHGEHEVPFKYEQYGEVQYLFPSNRTNSATTRGPDEVVLKDKSNWIKGEVIAHEYGHVLHLRAWDGDDYGWGGIGFGWSGSEQQHPRVAFKEGFANFVSRIVHSDQRACDSSFDSNHHLALLGDEHEGETWVRNVTKSLCDWHDTTNDDDEDIAGAGDHFNASVYSIWYNLRRMWVRADSYGGDTREGLGMCDYISYYLNVRKSSANVGRATHDNYVSSIADLAWQNYVSCDLPEPDGR